MKYKCLVPTARVGFAHGQMTETELESIIISFYRGRIRCFSYYDYY